MRGASTGATGATGAGRIGGIQMLRAVAALAIAFLHIEQAAGGFVGRPGQSPWPWLHAIPWEAGVDIFFVISGFVMVHASAAMFGSRSAVWPFLARRIARITPIYWLVTTLVLLIGAARPALLNDPLGGGIGAVVASYAFIPWPRTDGTLEPVFRLGWTLNAEMLFYAIFAALLPLPRGRALAGVIAVIALLGGVGVIVQPGNAQLAFWTDPIILEFAFGVAVGALRMGGARLGSTERLLLAALGIATLLALGPDQLPWRPLAYGLPAACLVAAAGLARHERRPSMTGRLWLILGDSSYALYLLHLFPMRALREAWTHLHWSGAAAIPPFIVASLAASCLLAIAAHRGVEQPLVTRTRAFLRA